MGYRIDERVPAPLRAVVELFQERAEELRFPDVDAEILGELAENWIRAEREVAAAEAALVAAREEQRSREDALAVQARRGIAYARVFAEGDPDLMEVLSAMALTTPEQAERTPKTRRRKRAEPQKDAAALPFPAEN